VQRTGQLIYELSTLYPDISGIAAEYGWNAAYARTADGLPYIGRTAAYKNLSLATGHAMMGLSLGPITGVLMSQILSGERPSTDLTLLSPDRYA